MTSKNIEERLTTKPQNQYRDISNSL